MQVVREDVSTTGVGGRNRTQHHGAGTVAEQDTGAAIVPVENPRKGFGSDDEGGARLAAAQSIVGDRQSKNKPSAYRLNVERSTARHFDPGLHPRRGSREGMVGSGGGEHKQIDVRPAHAGAVERTPGGMSRKIGGQLRGVGDAPFADAGALANPLVR